MLGTKVNQTLCRVYMRLDWTLKPLILMCLAISFGERGIWRRGSSILRLDWKWLILCLYIDWRKSFRRIIIVLCNKKSFSGSKNAERIGLVLVTGTPNFSTCKPSCEETGIELMVWSQMMVLGLLSCRFVKMKLLDFISGYLLQRRR